MYIISYLIFLSGAVSDRVERYSWTSHSWSDVTSAPHALLWSLTVTCRLGNVTHVFIVGGRHKGVATKTVQRYHTDNDTWTFASPLPHPVDAACAGCTCSKDNTRLFITSHATCMTYHINTDSWTSTPVYDDVARLCKHISPVLYYNDSDMMVLLGGANRKELALHKYDVTTHTCKKISSATTSSGWGYSNYVRAVFLVNIYDD